jgi:hypothetical protein
MDRTVREVAMTTKYVRYGLVLRAKDRDRSWSAGKSYLVSSQLKLTKGRVSSDLIEIINEPPIREIKLRGYDSRSYFPAEKSTDYEFEIDLDFDLIKHLFLELARRGLLSLAERETIDIVRTALRHSQGQPSCE